MKKRFYRPEMVWNHPESGGMAFLGRIKAMLNIVAFRPTQERLHLAL